MADPAPSPALFFDTLNAYQRSEALAAAIEVKLFTAIAEGNHTAAAIAQRCKIAERGARILADYLTVLGFLTKQDSRYGLTLDSAVFLDERSPGYAGAAAEFLLAPHLRENFGQLTARVKNGGAMDEGGAILETSPIADEVWARFARGMGSFMAMPATLLAGQIVGGSTAPMKILDIAASHGLWGIAFAKANPNARVAGLDFAAVLPVAEQNAAKMGVAARYSTLPGDAFKVAFGTGYDLVLLPNILHHFDAATCETLLKKVHAALAPDGRAVIVEFIPNADRISPPTSAMFSLVMLSSTPAGDAYTAAELQAMLQHTGFASSALSDIAPGMQQVVIAQK